MLNAQNIEYTYPQCKKKKAMINLELEVKMSFAFSYMTHVIWP